MTIRGSGRLTGVTDRGLVHGPMDLSAIEFASFTNVHGQLVRNDGVGTADGTFSVPVPRGSNSWELLGADFVGPIVAVGDARHPTLDQTVLGRLDGVFATGETDVTFAVTGLEPWVSGGADTTELTVGNNGGVIFSPEGAGPADGATTLASTFDWSTASAPSPLVDAAKGDRVVLSQLTSRASGSESYQALANAGTAAPGYTQSEGVASTLTIEMSPVPQTHVSLRWRGDSFDALNTDVGVGSVSFENGAGAFLDTLPDADRFGFYGFAAPDLLIYFPTDIKADIRIDASYGNPYHSNSGKRWDEFMTMFYTYSVPIQLGSALPGSVFASYQSNRSMRQLDGTVKPRISPPRHIQFSGDQLRWDGPAFGHATQYIVTIETLSVSDAGGTVATRGTSFWTTNRSLRIPEQYLAPGTSFVAFISAVDFGNVDRTTDLNGDSLPFDAAPAVSSTFTR